MEVVHTFSCWLRHASCWTSSEYLCSLGHAGGGGGGDGHTTDEQVVVEHSDVIVGVGIRGT